MRYLLLFLISLLISVLNAEQLITFSDDAYLKRYQNLLEELRCPKCQNQNLADSNAPISNDLKEEIQRLLEQGLDDDDIKRALTERYSDFILYDPKFNKNTYFLWLAPFIVLLIGFWWVYSMSTKNYISQSKDRDLEK
ncbi:MAG: cytochrome c-type biogenesis protein [Pseudomonadota bacterium]|jgi:cytochrome c-type biogenesis protein CcmH|nr:cytochrome C biogenesis protein cycl [Porticoccaceae bacterium]MCH2559752.1 cytochrome c-type biogenesis protein CcmH [Pseudomonadales bacterium]MEC7390413.1 cytochrome c-type biogenesis protein [Pseudomonadota bacterium]MAN53437.1 cytochrome C biogenesis protein cycl [Porticoccaceae bacterium]MEC7620881.1 cytochrome c-type biogenesis protein [Pseudomonadota bacterium]|tara:strand:+ start:1247 stop:1660 length:414 start_codon:yes stop_codon:yes gene_type:complete